MNDLRDSDLPTLRDENLTNILLYGNEKYNDKTNQIILMHVIRNIKDSQRFDEPLTDLLQTFHRFVTVSLFLTSIKCRVFMSNA